MENDAQSHLFVHNPSLRQSPEHAHSAHILLFGKPWEIEYLEQQESTEHTPKNFGIVIPDTVYRGSWPKNFDALTNLGISRLITLFSSNDPSELHRLPTLQQQVQQSGLTHTIVDIQTNEDLWIAAHHVFPLHEHKKTYIHCSAGANRTSCVSLITQILYLQGQCDETTLKKIIGQSLHHGFDFDKEKYRSILEQILQESVKKKLLSPSLFC